MIVGQAQALEIPLMVAETAGTGRVGNSVNSGVPLPMGVVRDVAELRLLDEQGRPVLASIEPRARWLGDESLKWVTLHFLTDLPANGKRALTLATAAAPMPVSELVIEQRGNTITVVTGPAKFVIPTDRFAPFDQVYVRHDMAVAFADADAMLAKPATLVLVAQNGESRVVPRIGEHEDEFRTELVTIDAKPFTQTATVQSTAIEERGPGRAVVALQGTFSTSTAESLDFTARLYFYSGSAAAELTFSVRNRQMDDMARFVGIHRLAVEVPLKIAGRSIVSLAVDGERVAPPLAASGVRIAQTQRDTYAMNSEAAEGRYDGWIRLASEAGTLTAGTRWSWQVHPVGAQVRADGTVALDLKSAEGLERAKQLLRPPRYRRSHRATIV